MQRARPKTSTGVIYFLIFWEKTTNPSFGKRVPLSVTPIMEYAHSYLLSDKGGAGTTIFPQISHT